MVVQLQHSQICCCCFYVFFYLRIPWSEESCETHTNKSSIFSKIKGHTVDLTVLYIVWSFPSVHTASNLRHFFILCYCTAVIVCSFVPFIAVEYQSFKVLCNDFDIKCQASLCWVFGWLCVCVCVCLFSVAQSILAYLMHNYVVIIIHFVACLVYFCRSVISLSSFPVASP